jgi:hypothetical protein
MPMNPRLILLVGCLALTLRGQETTTVAPEVSSLLAQPEDAAKQRDILHLLPKFIGRSSDLEALSQNMRLDLLESADCGLMAKTALEIERALESNLAGIRPPRRGGAIGPVDQIKFRLKRLVLPDVAAFDETLVQSAGGGLQTLGPPSRFWSLLVLWIDTHGIKSPEALAIKAEVDSFSTQPDVAHYQAEVTPLLSVRTAEQARESKPAAPTPSEEPASPTSWSIIVVLNVALLGLLWLVLKRRS